MNLYSNSYTHFFTPSTLDSVNGFKPKPSDYEPIQPKFEPKPSDYVPIVFQPPVPDRQPAWTHDFSASIQMRKYSEQELREIGSKPKEEIVEFFKNIGGNVRTYTETDEITGAGTFTIYSSPLLDNKEYHTTDKGKGYWHSATNVLTSGNLHEDSNVHKRLPDSSLIERVELETIKVWAKPKITLSETEIQKILNTQNGIFPSPVETPNHNSIFGDTNALFPAKPNDPPPPEFKKLETDLATEHKSAHIIASTISLSPSIGFPNSDHTENQAPPEETAKSLVGDTAAQIDTASSILAKPLEERAQVLQRTAELKSELAATYANGMITFQNGEMPADAADFYARNPGALAETVEAMRQEAKEMHKIGGENAGKAYLLGVAGKLAGGTSNGLDILELGSRLNKAYHEDTQSNWDSVYGQLSKMMVGAAGGAAALGTARAVGTLLVGTALAVPMIKTAIVIGVGVAVVVVVSEAADFIESEISKGNTILSAPVEDVTDLVLVGDMHLPIDARLRADNVVVFGNQRFDNLEVEADKLEVIGSLSAEGNFIVQAEEASVTPSENVAQTLMEKAQAEAVAAAQNGTDSPVQTEQVADVPAEAAESVPAEPPIAENKTVIGYDSPENILPDGSRIDDEMFLYYENQENLLSQPVSEIPVPADESVAYPDTVTPDIGVPDIYDDYILY